MILHFAWHHALFVGALLVVAFGVFMAGVMCGVWLAEAEHEREEMRRRQMLRRERH